MKGELTIYKQAINFLFFLASLHKQVDDIFVHIQKKKKKKKKKLEINNGRYVISLFQKKIFM